VKRIIAIMLGIAICATASTTITSAQTKAAKADLRRATDAAYRDGLFLGQFDANRGRARHMCVGRWSADVDRDSFVAGYKAGYVKLEQQTDGDN
jgi:hypothetical protein